MSPSGGGEGGRPRGSRGSVRKGRGAHTSVLVGKKERTRGKGPMESSPAPPLPGNVVAPPPRRAWGLCRGRGENVRNMPREFKVWVSRRRHRYGERGQARDLFGIQGLFLEAFPGCYASVPQVQPMGPWRYSSWVPQTLPKTHRPVRRLSSFFTFSFKKLLLFDQVLLSHALKCKGQK